jgi:SdrD B-like domain
MNKFFTALKSLLPAISGILTLLLGVTFFSSTLGTDSFGQNVFQIVAALCVAGLFICFQPTFKRILRQLQRIYPASPEASARIDFYIRTPFKSTFRSSLMAAPVLLLLGLFWSAAPQSMQAQCSITLTSMASGCYQSGGMSKATISVEVAWANATVSSTANNTSDLITVTLGSQTRTINPGPYTSGTGNGTIVSPQVVTFEVDANGASGSISAVFANDPNCMGTGNYTSPAACPPLVCATGQTGGIVWNDFDANGIKESDESTGVQGVTVQAYDCAGNLVESTTTDASGAYVFSSIPASASARTARQPASAQRPSQ